MKQKGFTLIEMIVVIVILSIVATIGGLLLVEGFQASNDTQNALEAGWQTRLTMRLMARELRNTRELVRLRRKNIRFNDMDGNEVRYRYQGGSNDRIQRRIFSISTMRTLADNITAFRFDYFGTDNNNLGTPNAINLNDVRCISISLTVDKYGTVNNLQTTVCPRNLLYVGS